MVAAADQHHSQKHSRAGTADARHRPISPVAVTRFPSTLIGGPLRLTLEPGPVLRLGVCDDGGGMPEGWRAGVGITAMRERVAELGGALTIGPLTPRGTRIEACLPAATAPEPASTP